MELGKKEIILYGYKTFYKDRVKGLKAKKFLTEKYGIQFYLKRKTSIKTGCKKNIIKTEYPEGFYLC